VARVLIVEDDENLRDMVREWLVFEKHVVTACGSGMEALEQLSVLTFDVILLDWHLEDMYGIDILKKFRAAGGTTPVMILTGGSGNEDREKAMQAGANSYVRKPFKLTDLSQSITALILKESGGQNFIKEQK